MIFRPFRLSPCCPTALKRSVLTLGLLVLAGACQQSPPSIQSYLEGRVLDSSNTAPNDHSGFRVLVLRPDGRQLDTLGHARTDREGRFQMTISAPDRGVYSLSLWNQTGRTRLASTDYVVAPNDSATLQIDLPLQQQTLRPESPENQALLAYQNAMTMHRRMLTRHVQDDTYGSTLLVQNTRLTSSILWSLRDRYPDTYAGTLAAVESLSFLEGWNDSLVVARARQIDPSSPRFVDVVRIARRAEARRHGHRAALALLNTFEGQTGQPSQQAGIQALRVQAFLDSLQVKAALSGADQLRAEHGHSSWARWARRVRYEAKHLQPGMKAPNLVAQTLEGDSLSLRSLRGRPVVLEYYRPGSDLYNLQRPLRNALYEATRPDSVAFVSISLDPDSLINRAYLHNQSLPGRTVIAPNGPQDPLATRYNVVHVPTRVLINEAGNIVDRYHATDFPTLRQHLTQRLQDTPRAPFLPSH